MDNKNILCKLTKIFDEQIEFHMTLINKHTEKINILQKTRLMEMDILLNELDTLTPISTNVKYEKKSDDIDDIDNKLFDNLHDIDINSTMSEELKQSLPADMDMGLGDQDLIWDRIRQSQLKLNKDKETKTEAETSKDIVISFSEPTKKSSIIRENNLEFINTPSDKVITDLQVSEVELLPPKINALFKVNPTTRNKIIKDTFKQATENISKLRIFDSEIDADFHKFVQKEADRLLDVYLKTH
jgi:hypothetical protein